MDVNLRSDFPILQRTVNGKPLIYLDNAATTQKPQAVLDAMTTFYSFFNAPVRRGIYELAEEATLLFENARAAIANFIGAYPDETIITKGATEGINFIAQAWGHEHIKAGDEIIVTELEHHANFLPWQRLAQQKQAVLKIVPITDDGDVDYAAFKQMLTHKTKLVAVTHVSNVLGTQVDIAMIINNAHAVGAKVLIDAAQSIAHQDINVHALDCDFLVFSGHKMLGPTGIGILYIKRALHQDVPPYQVGGGMVFEVGRAQSFWLEAPYKFEAGTPATAELIGLAAALDYRKKTFSIEQLRTHEAILSRQLIEGLQTLGLPVLGPIEQLKQHGHIVSFIVPNVHGHDVAAYLAQQGICVRAGHHCAQILHNRLGVEASVRVSLYAYNTAQEVDQTIYWLQQLLK